MVALESHKDFSARGLSRRVQEYFVVICIVLAWGASPSLAVGQPSEPVLTAPPPSLWKAGVGEGFNRGTSELSLSAGGGFGVAAFGGQRKHDWALGVAEYGWIFSDVKGEGRWYRGNWELASDVFGGAQFSPSHAYLVGLTPLLRYNFAVGHRLVPFFNLGAGLTATDIRDGDLSTTFEFNLQGGAGLRLFLRDNLALTFQYRFIHISNAGIDTPNNGVNNNTLLLGLGWFF